MLKYFYFVLISISLNVLSDIILYSPEINTNSNDERVIELKIKNANVKDSEIFINEYKSEDIIDDNLIKYTLLENFDDYQTFKIVLSSNYFEDYFSFQINIKDKLKKDIFIFLPSKSRGSQASQEITITNQSLSNVSQNDISNINEVSTNTEVVQKIYEAEDISTMWSLATEIKQGLNDISIYQIMWSIYLGNKSAFIDNNINLIRSDIDIQIPNISEMENISFEIARNSILDMNTSFSSSFKTASRSLLVLTAPKVVENQINTEEILEKTEDVSQFTFDDISDPKTLIENNTKEISLGIENDTAQELISKTKESAEVQNDKSFELMDILFISLVSVLSGILLALIYIQYNNYKNGKKILYDFEEAVDDDKTEFGIPDGLSINNNRDQQQFDLAVTYFEMKDYDASKNILNYLIKESKDEEIKSLSSNLLSKINQE
ncbi:MAG: FimV/HubP family polar landmark protein [Gammaproteobacteria bacterium]